MIQKNLLLLLFLSHAIYSHDDALLVYEDGVVYLYENDIITRLEPTSEIITYTEQQQIIDTQSKKELKEGFNYLKVIAAIIFMIALWEFGSMR